MPSVAASLVKDASSHPELVACCGLYCGDCSAYLIRRCGGCRLCDKTASCQVRACCLRAGYATCAECTTHPDAGECPLYRDFAGRATSSPFRANRTACLDRIKTIGLATYAREMTAAHRRSRCPA